MTHIPVTVHTLENGGDHRGDACQIPDQSIRFLGAITEAHLVTVLPGMIRGNHVHAERDEVLVVSFTDGCRVAWRGGATGQIETREFDGEGTVAIELPAGVAHAVKNTGERDVQLASFSNRADGSSEDTTRSVLLE